MPVRLLLAIAAAALPSLLAHNVSPSATFWNQALALALWGAFAAACRVPDSGRGSGRAAWAGALALLLAGVVWSWSVALPASLALSAIGTLLAAAVLAGAGAGTQSRPDAAKVFGDFCIAWAVAGAANALIACVQVFAPEWADGVFIAQSTHPGRAVGNLRQPNHLNSLLVWSAIATVALVQLRRLHWRWAAPLFAGIVFAVLLTGSRTGWVDIAAFVLWALLDRRLARPARWLLLAAPLVFALSWGFMDWWAADTQQHFGAEERLAASDISSSRFGIWKNTLALIAAHPWAGVGFGEFNLAWTLTAFPGRPVAFFDHTHNLPLQLAVELGLPLAVLVLAGLGLALWRAGWLAFAGTSAEGEAGAARRAAFWMIVTIGVHSLLEYPLWYAYFLLPAAWALAFAAGEPPAADAEGSGRRASLPMLAGGIALVVGALVATLDYRGVSAIFSPAADAGPLDERIARGRRSLFFAHHADYAAATTGLGAGGLVPFERATHYLLDTRLMIAWAKALDAAGDEDRARWVADRLREFDKADADEFFAACDDAAPAPAGAGPASAPQSFQCTKASGAHDWREFLAR